MGARLTVFVGRGPLSAAIRQTLEDLAALNLVVDYLWVDADAFQSSASLTSCVLAAPNGGTSVQFMPLNEALTRTRATKLNIGVINDVSAAAGVVRPDQLAALTEAIDAVDIGRRAPRTNLLLAAVDTPGNAELPLLRGYNNLLLAPEDSIGPDVTPVAYVHGHEGTRYVLHCAAGIASLFGLWEGHADAPVLEMEPAHGETFRLVRAFYRRIDGQEVQQKLKERIFDTNKNPLPLLDHPGQNVAAHYTADYRTFNKECADELIQEYQELLRGPRVEGVSERTRQQSNTGAAGEFLRTYGKNLVTAPKRWLRSNSDELSNLTSQAIQSSLYGTDSRVQVGGGPLLGQENPRMAVAKRINREQVARDYAPLWQSYENMALTMIDAKPRPFGQSPVPRYPRAVGTTELGPVYVAPSAEVVIPGPSVRFGNNLPPQLKAMLRMDSIASYDQIEADRYRDTLSKQAEFRHRNIGQIIGDFGHWRSKHSDSFAVNVSDRLVHTMHDVDREATQWQARAKQLRNRREQQPKNSATAIMVLRWLGYVSFWSWVAFLGLWAVFRTNLDAQGLPTYQWVRAFEMSETSTKTMFLGVWFVLWLVLYMSQVFLETRDEIRLLNRRRTLISDIEAAETNYLTCLEAQERIKIGYHQFVALSHQLGAVSERPFGTVRQYRVDNVIPTNDMPDSVLLAEATPDDAVIEKVARSFRASMYRQGWMQGHVHEGRTLATAQLEHQAGIPVRTDNLHALTGRGTGTALDSMGILMAGPEYNSVDRSVDEWGSITQGLKEVVRREHAEILQPMRINRGGKKTQAPALQPLRSTAQVGSFNAEFITEAGRIHAVDKVDVAYFRPGGSEFDAIGVSEVLIQVSRPARAEDIRVGAPRRMRAEKPEAQQPVSGDDWMSPQPSSDRAPTASPTYMPGEGEF